MGFKIISGIDCLDDGFRFDQHGLSCFIVPKYLASRAFRPLNADLFYLYVYLYDHYDLLSFLKDSNDPAYAWYSFHNLFALAHYVLKQKLGLELLLFDVEEDLYQQVIHAIDQGWPVFVPVDRGELFYNCAYHRITDPHLILIKGYNTDTGVLVIHDFEQNYHLLNDQPIRPSGDIYSQFYLLPQMLQTANASFSHHFHYFKQKFDCLRFLCEAPIQTEQEALRDIAAEITRHLDTFPAILIEKFQMLLNQTRFSLKARMSYLNSQQILILTLTKLLKAACYSPEKEQLIKATGYAAYQAWKGFLTIVGVLERKHEQNLHLLKNQRDIVSQKEYEFLQAIAQIM